MKKCVCLMLILVIGLISCGDDDKPSLPKLNKLTKITCKKNARIQTFFGNALRENIIDCF